MTNSKGARIQEEKTARIMHENAILLSKLSRILTRENDVLPLNDVKAKEGLHDVYRRKQREKIDFENQILLRHLRDMKSSFDINKFEAEARERAAILKLMQAPVNPALVPGGHRPHQRPRPRSAGDIARRQAQDLRMPLVQVPQPVLAAGTASMLIRPNTIGSESRPLRSAPPARGAGPVQEEA
eukprot:scaffold16258_cov141-Isochrysis_galbana.AAC.4